MYNKFKFLGVALIMLSGCDKGLDITIPAGSHIAMKLNYINDTLIGDVLPTGNLHADPSQWTVFGMRLEQNHCSLGIDAKYDRVYGHVADSASLVCDGVEHLELDGELVDSQGNKGLKSVTLGDQLNFLVKKTVTVN